MRIDDQAGRLSADDPAADRARLMRFIYSIAATEAHAKNYSLLMTRGVDRPSIRLAPLYDVASAWPYHERIPVQKMKPAMRVGDYCRFRQIQVRHFDDLARSCSYPPEALRGWLMELVRGLPDEAVALGATLRTHSATGEVLSVLIETLPEPPAERACYGLS